MPKPHTPFQWAAQEEESRLNDKHEILRQGLHYKDVRLSWNDPKVSQLEAAISRGDRRLGGVIHRAWELGAKFDGWSEHFNYENWLTAFRECGLTPEFYARRERSQDETLPWAHINCGVSEEFLKRELKNALENEETIDCRSAECHACGIQLWHPECPKSKILRISFAA